MTYEECDTFSWRNMNAVELAVKSTQSIRIKERTAKHELLCLQRVRHASGRSELDQHRYRHLVPQYVWYAKEPSLFNDHEYRVQVKLQSHSPVFMTSPCEQKIFELEENFQTNKKIYSPDRSPTGRIMCRLQVIVYCKNQHYEFFTKPFLQFQIFIKKVQIFVMCYLWRSKFRPLKDPPPPTFNRFYIRTNL